MEDKSRTTSKKPVQDSEEPAFASAMTDTGFKNLMSDTEVAKDIINTFVPDFQEENRIKELESKKINGRRACSSGIEELRVDFYAKTSKEESIEIRMQRIENDMSCKKALYFLCEAFADNVDAAPVTSQLRKFIKDTYAINFLEYDSDELQSREDKETDVDASKSKERRPEDNNFVFHYKFMDTMGSGKEVDQIQLIQIELPKAARILGIDEYVEKLNDPDLAVKLDEESEQEEKKRIWTTILCRSDELNEVAYKKLPDIVKRGLDRLEVKN